MAQDYAQLLIDVPLALGEPPPIAPIDDGLDGRSRDADEAPDFTLRHTFSREPANFLYRFFVKNGPRILDASRTSSMRDCISAVFCLSGPAEIFWRVVNFRPIVMSDAMLWGWSGSVEGCAYQFMHRENILPFAIKQGRHGIPGLPIEYRRPDPADLRSGRSASALHAPQATDLIRPAFNRLPDFYRIALSHIGLLHRSIGQASVLVTAGIDADTVAGGARG